MIEITKVSQVQAFNGFRKIKVLLYLNLFSENMQTHSDTAVRKQQSSQNSEAKRFTLKTNQINCSLIRFSTPKETFRRDKKSRIHHVAGGDLEEETPEKL